MKEWLDMCASLLLVVWWDVRGGEDMGPQGLTTHNILPPGFFPQPSGQGWLAGCSVKRGHGPTGTHYS